MKSGETNIHDVLTRVSKKVEAAAALTAKPSSACAPGSIIAVKDLHAIAVYDEESVVAVASGRVYVPDDIAATAAYIADPATAPGRWHVIASDAVLATADAAVGAVKRTVTVGHADLTDAVNGEAQSINIGAVLPANARIVGVDLRSYTPFTGGSASAVALDIGTSGDVDAIVDGADVFAAAVDGGPSTMPRGIRPNKMFVTAGAQLLATFTPDGGHTLLGLTAGSIVIDVWYLVLA